MKDAARGVEEPLPDEVDSSRFDVIVDDTEFEGIKFAAEEFKSTGRSVLFSSEMYWIAHLVE